MGSRAAFGGGHHGGDVPVTAARTTPRPTHDAPNTVSGLVRKRAEIAGHIEVAQIGLRRMIADLDHIDAAIRMLVPEAAVTGSVRFAARSQWPLPTQSGPWPRQSAPPHLVVRSPRPIDLGQSLRVYFVVNLSGQPESPPLVELRTGGRPGGALPGLRLFSCFSPTVRYRPRAGIRLAPGRCRFVQPGATASATTLDSWLTRATSRTSETG
jgi:hypothetical protein